MMEIVFANTRYEYDSYTDYRRLVELAGFRRCYIDEIDVRNPYIYIVSPINGEFRPHIDNHRDKEKKCKIVYWCLERPGSLGKFQEFANSNKELLDKEYIDEVWISDRWVVHEHHDPRVKFVIMGSDHRLCPNDDFGWKFANRKKHDYIHLSYQTYRRSVIMDRFRVDHKMREAANCWPPERDDALRYSKFFINLHQDEVDMQEPLRVALCASYGLPYICEHCIDPYPLQKNVHYLDIAYSKFKDSFVAINNHTYAPYMKMGQKLHNLLCYKHKFADEVRKACGHEN